MAKADKEKGKQKVASSKSAASVSEVERTDPSSLLRTLGDWVSSKSKAPSKTASLSPLSINDHAEEIKEITLTLWEDLLLCIDDFTENAETRQKVIGRINKYYKDLSDILGKKTSNLKATDFLPALEIFEELKEKDKSHCFNYIRAMFLYVDTLKSHTEWLRQSECLSKPLFYGPFWQPNALMKNDLGYYQPASEEMVEQEALFIFKIAFCDRSVRKSLMRLIVKQLYTPGELENSFSLSLTPILFKDSANLFLDMKIGPAEKFQLVHTSKDASRTLAKNSMPLLAPDEKEFEELAWEIWPKEKNTELLWNNLKLLVNDFHCNVDTREKAASLITEYYTLLKDIKAQQEKKAFDQVELKENDLNTAVCLFKGYIKNEEFDIICSMVLYADILDSKSGCLNRNYYLSRQLLSIDLWVNQLTKAEDKEKINERIVRIFRIAFNNPAAKEKLSPLLLQDLVSSESGTEDALKKCIENFTSNILFPDIHSEPMPKSDEASISMDASLETPSDISSLKSSKPSTLQKFGDNARKVKDHFLNSTSPLSSNRQLPRRSLSSRNVTASVSSRNISSSSLISTPIKDYPVVSEPIERTHKPTDVDTITDLSNDSSVAFSENSDGSLTPRLPESLEITEGKAEEPSPSDESNKDTYELVEIIHPPQLGEFDDNGSTSDEKKSEQTPPDEDKKESPDESISPVQKDIISTIEIVSGITKIETTKPFDENENPKHDIDNSALINSTPSKKLSSFASVLPELSDERQLAIADSVPIIMDTASSRTSSLLSTEESHQSIDVDTITDPSSDSYSEIDLLSDSSKNSGGSLTPRLPEISAFSVEPGKFDENGNPKHDRDNLALINSTPSKRPSSFTSDLPDLSDKKQLAIKDSIPKKTPIKTSVPLRNKFTRRRIQKDIDAISSIEEPEKIDMLYSPVPVNDMDHGSGQLEEISDPKELLKVGITSEELFGLGVQPKDIEGSKSVWVERVENLSRSISSIFSLPSSIPVPTSNVSADSSSNEIVDSHAIQPSSKNQEPSMNSPDSKDKEEEIVVEDPPSSTHFEEPSAITAKCGIPYKDVHKHLWVKVHTVNMEDRKKKEAIQKTADARRIDELHFQTSYRDEKNRKITIKEEKEKITFTTTEVDGEKTRTTFAQNGEGTTDVAISGQFRYTIDQTVNTAKELSNISGNPIFCFGVDLNIKEEKQRSQVEALYFNALLDAGIIPIFEKYKQEKDLGTALRKTYQDLCAKDKGVAEKYSTVISNHNNETLRNAFKATEPAQIDKKIIPPKQKNTSSAVHLSTTGHSSPAHFKSPPPAKLSESSKQAFQPKTPLTFGNG